MTNEQIGLEVIKQAQQGNHLAFKKIIETYQTMIFNLAYRMTYNKEDATDLCQEIFLRLYQKIRTFDTNRDFMPWFHRLATNVCLNWKAQPKLKTISLDKNGKSDEVNYRTLDISSDPETPLEKNIIRDKINRVIMELSQGYRLVITLYYLQDMSYEEIAKTLLLPLGTVKNRLFRAREILKERLKHK